MLSSTIDSERGRCGFARLPISLVLSRSSVGKDGDDGYRDLNWTSQKVLTEALQSLAEPSADPLGGDSSQARAEVRRWMEPVLKGHSPKTLGLIYEVIAAQQLTNTLKGIAGGIGKTYEFVALSEVLNKGQYWLRRTEHRIGSAVVVHNSVVVSSKDYEQSKDLQELGSKPIGPTLLFGNRPVVSVAGVPPSSASGEEGVVVAAGPPGSLQGKEVPKSIVLHGGIQYGWIPHPHSGAEAESEECFLNPVVIRGAAEGEQAGSSATSQNSFLVRRCDYRLTTEDAPATVSIIEVIDVAKLAEVIC
jgi:hypothetical protein